MEYKWNIKYIGQHRFEVQEDLTEDAIKKCRDESSTFDKLCEKLIKRERSVWNRF